MTDRYHYLDAARGVLMILGIVFHAAYVYGTAPWLINDDARSPLFDAITGFLTSFRMPAFFLISGFFAALTLAREGPTRFARNRARRIVVPFVTALLTVNLAQMYALEVYNGRGRSVGAFLTSPELWAAFPNDEWISHLWFLVCLAAYFGALSLAVPFVRRRPRRPTGVHTDEIASLVVQPVALLALPLGNLLVLAMFWVVPALYDVRILVNLNEILENAPYFIAGLFAFSSARVYAVLTRFRWSVVILTGAVALFLFVDPMTQTSFGAQVTHAYVKFLGAWIGVYWVMVAFRRLVNRHSRVASTLADASYTIYLFHHLVVVLVAWWLLDADISIFLKYPVVIGVTFGVTFALHAWVIGRVTLLSVLFNGRRPRLSSLRG